MKKNLFIIPLSLLVLIGSGCKKFLDINKDPNNPSNVQESLLLLPIETAISTTVAGGSLTIGNYTTIGETNEYWVQQIALNQLQPQADEYLLRPADLDQQFLTIYSTILQNSKILNETATARKNAGYSAIAKILTAYTLGITTDVWGDIPYSKAFGGAQNVPYDKQEDIYKTMQALLDSAITEASGDPGLNVPGSDDLLYGGDLSKWVKFAYTLKARDYIHLTKAPGYDAATQSGLALAALANGFTSTSDEASFAAYKNAAGSESPWYENTLSENGPIVLASTFVDTLLARNDPRLPIIATQSSQGGYVGRVIGTDPAGDYTIYSGINTFYAGIDAPQPILTYSEALFIQAEAVFRTAGAAAATPIFINAINSNMSKLGLDTTSAAVTAYVAKRAPLTASNGLERIIEDKVVANFLSTENFTDWRRTGYPKLELVLNAHQVSEIPRRYPYPLGEETANPQPQQSAKITDRVWWDAP